MKYEYKWLWKANLLLRKASFYKEKTLKYTFEKPYVHFEIKAHNYGETFQAYAHKNKKN